MERRFTIPERPSEIRFADPAAQAAFERGRKIGLRALGKIANSERDLPLAYRRGIEIARRALGKKT